MHRGTRITSPVKNARFNMTRPLADQVEPAGGGVDAFAGAGAGLAAGAGPGAGASPELFVSAGGASGFLSPSAAPPPLASFAPSLPAGGLRKSVTYQPEPFNWNPAAVTCFL